MKNKLMMHCGGRLATLDELALVPVPMPTRTFQPIPHNEFAQIIEKKGREILNLDVRSHEYGLSRNGNQVFGLIQYQNGNSELIPTTAWRSSYDKSLAAGIANGKSVFICDNLALTGEFITIRKHTTNILRDLDNILAAAFANALLSFTRIDQDADTMRQEWITTDRGYELLGRLYGHKVLPSRIFNKAVEEWENPTHPAFGDRNLWSLYNSCTEALKRSQIEDVIPRHLLLHERLMSEMF